MSHGDIFSSTADLSLESGGKCSEPYLLTRYGLISMGLGATKSDIYQLVLRGSGSVFKSNILLLYEGVWPTRRNRNIRRVGARQVAENLGRPRILICGGNSLRRAPCGTPAMDAPDQVVALALLFMFIFLLLFIY